MCPLCVMGSLFFVQVMAFIRWFYRVILRKPVAGDGEFWEPEKVSFADRIQLALQDRKKCMLIGCLIAAEVVLAIVVYHFGGFKIIRVVWEALQ